MNKENSTGTDYQALLGQALCAEDYAGHVSETLETDIVVVGAGASGLPAALEAQRAGKRVTVLEHNRTVGGSGIATYGILGVNSPFQKRQGINVSVGQIVKMEAETYNYRTDGARLYQMLADSGENIQWLMENGVKFTGVVDTYMDDGLVRTYHWFAPQHSGVGFIQPMQDTFLAAGGTLLLQTDGKRLFKDRAGRVAGIFARTAEDKILKINCGAVILANGGYENNPALLAARGYDSAHLSFRGAGGHDGSGFYMALDAGGANWMEHSALLESPTNMNLAYLNGEYMHLWIGMQGRQVIVNGRGERFFDEAACRRMRGFPMLAIRAQRDLGAFEIYSQDILDAAVAHVRRNAPANYPNAKRLIPDSLAAGCKGLYQADTPEGLAQKAGLPAERLCATLADYNRYCAQHEDEEFGKAPDAMWAIQPPYYCMQYTDVQFISTHGCVHTGRDCQVLNERHEAIPGLYAVGTLGAEFWPGYYSIGIPGAANAFNVDSGRRAARHAARALS